MNYEVLFGFFKAGINLKILSAANTIFNEGRGFKSYNYCLVFCLFDLILYIPVNNFSVMSGWVFLG